MESNFAIIRNFANLKVLNLPVSYLQVYAHTKGVNPNITFRGHFYCFNKALQHQDRVQGISLKGLPLGAFPQYLSMIDFLQIKN